MECSRYKLDRIIEINEKEIIYKEDRGDLISIDLQACRKRYLRYLNAHLENYPERNDIPIKDNEDFRCVGDCYFYDSGISYFEFYDWPHIRFEINMKLDILVKFFNLIGLNRKKKYYNQFNSIQKQILEAGWQTYELR